MAQRTKTIIGVVSFLSILAILVSNYGATISTDGDQKCGTTCTSHIQVCIPNYSVTFVLKQGLQFYFDKNVTYEVYANGKQIKNATKFKFKQGCTNFTLVGHKRVEETVKWIVGAAGKETPDPIWRGENETVTYTPSTENHCIGNTCTMTLYSGIRYVSEDNQWKKVEDARSLKGKGFDVVYLENDSNFTVNVLDFNLTSITVSYDVNDNQKGIDIPIKVFKNGNKLDILSSKTKKFKSKGDVQTETLPFSLDSGLEFGFNSTTITLNESNSGNVGDTYVRGSSTTNNYGTTTFMSVRTWSSGNYRAFLLWNLNVVPNGAQISNANLSLYVETGPSTTMTIQAYNTSLYNSSGAGPWVEGSLNNVACSASGCLITRNLTWANMPLQNTTQGPTVSVATSFTGIKEFNITNASISTFSNASNKNMSIMIRSVTEGGAGESVSFTSKEGATAGNRPQLIITYTPADTTPPSITIQSPTNTTYGGSVWFNATLNEPGSSVWFSLDSTANKTMTNSSGNWNYQNTSMTNGAHTVRFFANDTSGNLNASALNNVSFTVDIIPPKITISSPTNTTYGTSTWFNVTIDQTGSWCGYSLDKTANVTMANSTGNWNALNSSMANGAHNVTFSCNDTYGNMNSSSPIVYFTTDAIAPTITISSPTNTTYSQNWVWTNVTLSQTGSWCGVSLNGTANQTLTNSTGNWNKNLTVPSAGANNVKFWCNDTYGNMGNSSTVYFTISGGLPDSNCTFGAGIVKVSYAPTIYLSNPPSNSNMLWVNATNQTAIVSLFNCTNNGTGAGTFQMKMNVTLGNRTDTCGTSASYTNAINLTTAYQNIGSSISAGGLLQIWCKRGYNSSVLVNSTFKYLLNITS